MDGRWRWRRRLGWWHIPVSCGVLIAAFFVAWELLEFHFVESLAPTTRRWLYVCRGVFGASCIAAVAGLLVRRHERRLTEMRHGLVQTEKLAAIGQMAAGMAHEIGNPLAAISSLVQLLQRANLPEADRGKLALILSEIERVNRIVRQMVDFSRPAPAEPRGLDVVQIVDLAIELARYDPRARAVRFERRYGVRNVMVQGVREHLTQVFLNIIYNAIDAMPDGGLLTVRAASEADYVVLEFKDSGHGIAAEHLEQVFRPFFTTKGKGRGTGLGLAVTKQLVTQHHGQIALESRPGQGTSVRISLPMSNGRVDRNASEGRGIHDGGSRSHG